jgi:CO/xanthine dehydrogenase Mo-binding subunit
MSPNRREVLVGLGGATIAYALQVGCAAEQDRAAVNDPPRDQEPTDEFINRGRPNQPAIEARDWLIISAGGIATAYTSRTEIGQGLTTVMHDLVGQGLELSRDRVRVVLGDTDLCPADGPTTGSAATRYIAWAFWEACHEIKADLVLLASEKMGVAADELEYRSGDVVVASDPSRRIGIGDLADGQVRRVGVEAAGDPVPAPAYVDRGNGNVNAEAIVTGTLRYTGDYHPEGCVYGALLTPAYHATQTRLLLADLASARKEPGVVRVQRIDRHVAALGETYTAVQRAIRAMDSNWREPRRPRELDVEGELRAGAELRRVVEEKGNVDTAFAASALLISETYVTQFMTQVPMETDTAIASRENGDLQVRLGTQNPFYVRNKIAAQEGVPAAHVRVIAAPAGGAFGSKADNLVGEEAASLLRLTDAPVKYVYSRTDDIRRRSRFKEVVVFDVTTGVDGYGRVVGRTIDIFQDEGFGTREMYDIPNVRTRLYHARLPVRHATMRGTSFVQDVFALESHTDTLARRVGQDPLEFRRAHVELEAFLPLIDHCAGAFDYGSYSPPADHGVGFAICNHGGRQLGVVGAEVRVDPDSGEVSVVRLAGAFDIGVVINHTLATNGIKGAMIWGIGAALLEEVELDGHQCFTSGFSDYRIPRMSDTPPIEVAYFDNQSPGTPRGCGEVPVPPTTAAIANAVYAATGKRFHRLPITPERVLAALRG